MGNVVKEHVFLEMKRVFADNNVEPIFMYSVCKLCYKDVYFVINYLKHKRDKNERADWSVSIEAWFQIVPTFS